jgi:DNA-binding NarL/FixJ family response regulator
MTSEITYRQESATNDRPRLVIADDDALVRSMLASQLGRQFECVGVAADANEAITLVALHRPAVALLDANMPGGGAMHATHEIRTASPETAVVILSIDECRADVIALIDAGAMTYLRKGIPPQELAHRLVVSIDAHRHAMQRQNSAEGDICEREHASTLDGIQP